MSTLDVAIVVDNADTDPLSPEEWFAGLSMDDVRSLLAVHPRIPAGRRDPGRPNIVLVCGGREYKNLGLVDSVLTEYAHDNGIDLLVEGGARGADRMAREWAERSGVQFATVPALWDYYRRHGGYGRAGPIRNRAMLLIRPSLVIAFPGGNGTADMVDAAGAAGVQVWFPEGVPGTLFKRRVDTDERR